MTSEPRSTIPSFTESGLLPPGDYELSFDELRDSILVRGPKDRERCPHWDGEWRVHLIDNFEHLTRQLWSVGIREIFADGSFAED